MPHDQNKAGFSLVELSIVLVILGLLVGGVLSGRSLIRAAELRKIGVEYQETLTALNAFRDKYRAVPGDFNKATQFWGEETSCVFPTTAGTCDGDGSGLIRGVTIGGSFRMEPYFFWQHLALAKLTEGTYGLTAGQDMLTMEASQLFRPSKVGGQWIPLSVMLNAENVDAGGNAVEYDTYSFPAVTPANNAITLHEFGAGAVLTPEEMWSIDSKLDDGSPSTGAITVLLMDEFGVCAVDVGGSVATATTLSARYNLASSQKSCAPILRL